MRQGRNNPGATSKNMKKSVLLYVRMGVLGVALTALTGCLEATESLQVPITTAADEGATDAQKKAAEPAVAVTPETAGEVKQQLAPAIPALSPGLAEIVRLAQAKVGEDVLLAYIMRSEVVYNPTTEEIIYLHDLGVSDKVVAEIIKRSPKPEMQTAETKVATPEQLNIPLVKTPAEQPAQAGPVLTPLVSTNPGPATVVAAQPVIVQQPVIVEQPIVIQQAPEEVRYFYSSLAPYGSWVDVDGYGWCWQPTVAVTYSDWRPYSQGGRWIYSDCGWYWQSDYSWGWAPFHYGRWFHHARRGWCWMPDRVWGPAWVSWRTSSAYCGWAPLPPVARYRSGLGLCYNDRHVGVGFEFGLGASDYLFVSFGHFYSSNPYRYCLPPSHVTKVYNQTTVNNVIIQGNNNNVVINQGGAPVTQISKATRTEVQKVSVMDMPAAQHNGMQPDRLVRQGGTLAVYRPTGPSNGARGNQEPMKATVATAPGARPSGSPMPSNHAPANLHPEYAKAPTTALQRYEAPSSSQLPSLQRPETKSSPYSRVGMPTQPAGTGIDRPLTPQQPVQPASISSTRALPYEAPSKRAPEVTRPMTTPQPVSGGTVTLSSPKPVSGPTVTPSQPRPVYGSAVTPSAPQPVQPATPEQARLTPQTPVSSYQAPPTMALRNEPNRPSSVTINKPGGYWQRPSVQPTYGGTSGNNSFTRETEPSRPHENGTPSYGTSSPSRPSQSYTAPSSAPSTSTYTQPTPSYSAPAQSSRPSYTPPSRPAAQPSYSAPSRPSEPASRPSYSAPVQQRPSYSAPVQQRPSYSPPAERPSVSTSSPRPSNPSPSPTSGIRNYPGNSSGSSSSGSSGGGNNKRPGGR